MLSDLPFSRTSVCLWLPTFELRLELVRTPELDATSVALLAPGSSGEGGEIFQISERAASAGVHPGMRVSRALGLCPALILLEPDPAHYAAATRDILEALEGVSPVVHSPEPGVFHVGVDGLERLYGGARSQVDRVLHTLLEVLPRPLVAAVRAGRAPGYFGARVASASARPGTPVLVEDGALPSFLAPHSVSLLPIPPDMVERLQRLDITTLGALGSLPLPALLRHFGSAGREARALARGERIDPVRPVHRPRSVRASLDFPSPVGDRETLGRGLERLVERGLGRPERKGRSIRAMRGGGQLEGGGSWEVSVTLREPSADRDTLVFPLRQRTLLSPPPRAVETLFVEFSDFGPPLVQRDLFHPKESGDQACRELSLPSGRISRTLREAVRELHLKLGHAPLYRVVEMDPWSRLPERRYALLELEP